MFSVNLWWVNWKLEVSTERRTCSPRGRVIQPSEEGEDVCLEGHTRESIRVEKTNLQQGYLDGGRHPGMALFMEFVVLYTALHETDPSRVFLFIAIVTHPLSIKPFFSQICKTKIPSTPGIRVLSKKNIRKKSSAGEALASHGLHSAANTWVVFSWVEKSSVPSCFHSGWDRYMFDQ